MEGMGKKINAYRILVWKSEKNTTSMKFQACLDKKIILKSYIF